ncbi:MAG: winged helix-turn-helix transcriptional regulator [Spirochaetes bacterium]|nr:winged helix-turn-helix transcriptional regulator [Spirochaetota bacterium]
MVELSQSQQNLDRVFAALADHSRRQMLVQLRQNSLSISELAKPHNMSFAGVAKHIEVLSTAGLVRKVRSAHDKRSFRIELANETLDAAATWIEYHRKFWTNKLDQLAAYLEEEENHERRSIKSRKKD